MAGVQHGNSVASCKTCRVVAGLRRARWFAPPALMTSWALPRVQFWVSLLSWPVLLVLVLALGAI